MRLWLFRPGGGVLLGLFCSLGVVCAQTDSKPARGRTLELSEPNAKAAITNLNDLSGQGNLHELEDELSKSLQPFSPRSSLDGELAPQYLPAPVPAARSRKLKDELERRENWMYLTPEDMVPGMSDADLLKTPELGPDGQPKKQTPLEQFYERLEREQRTVFQPKTSLSKDSFRSGERSGDEFGLKEEPNLPGGIRDSAQRLKRLLDDTGAGTDVPNGRGSLSDLFGLGDNSQPSKEDLDRHKAYMEEYRKVLEGSTLTPPSLYDPLKPADLPATSVSPNLDSLMTTTKPQTTTGPTLGTLGTVLTPGLLPDPNAAVLNQWNPFYNPQPKIEPPKPTTISVPMPEAPRRRF